MSHNVTYKKRKKLRQLKKVAYKIKKKHFLSRNFGLSPYIYDILRNNKQPN